MNYGIGNIKGKSKSLFTTTTAPTESGDVITLATTDIVESGFKVGDYLAYVDNGNISALYSISAISSGTATLSLIGNFGGGGGKQLYQHIINIVGYFQSNEIRGYFQIIDNINLPYAKNSDYVEGTNQNMQAYFQNKGFSAQNFDKCYPAIIYAYDNTLYNGVGAYNNYFYVFANYSQTALQLTGTTVKDTIIAL